MSDESFCVGGSWALTSAPNKFSKLPKQFFNTTCSLISRSLFMELLRLRIYAIMFSGCSNVPTIPWNTLVLIHLFCAFMIICLSSISSVILLTYLIFSSSFLSSFCFPMSSACVFIFYSSLSLNTVCFLYFSRVLTSSLLFSFISNPTDSENADCHYLSLLPPSFASRMCR